MKLIGFWCLLLGVILGGAAGYFVAVQNEPPSRLPNDISATLLPDFDLKKVLDQITPTEKDKNKLVWDILKDVPGKGDLENHRKFLQNYKQGSQTHSPQVLGIKTRVIVAQTKIAPDEQGEYWTVLYDRLAAAIIDLKLNVATPGAGGRSRPRNTSEKAQEVRTAVLEYTHIPGDRSPYPMRGIMHVAWVADGDLVSLVITMSEVFQTT
jgi:hypothetical protein